MNNILVIDTETANGFKNPLVYDCGFVVMDESGFIHEREHYAILEIIGNPHIMNTAYYAEKMPHYWQEVAKGNIKVMPFEKAIAKINAFMEVYDISTVAAYNFPFDRRALASTAEYLSGSAAWCKHKFTPLCIWAGACSSIMQTKKYLAFLRKHGFFTENDNPRTSAEICFRYLTGNADFIEAHTGGKDAEIEAHILANLLRRKQKPDFTPCANPWMKVAKFNKENGGI